MEYFLTFTDFTPIQPYAECISEVEDIVEESSDDATKVMTIRETLKRHRETSLINKKFKFSLNYEPLRTEVLERILKLLFLWCEVRRTCKYTKKAN